MENFRDYKEASNRHLQSSLRLLDIIKRDFSSEKLERNQLNEKNEILSNIYYLSGYVIECIVNYGILAYIDFEKIKLKHNITKVQDLKLGYNDKKVSYSNNSDKSARYYLYHFGHKQYSNRFPNIHFFENEAKISSRELDNIKSIISNDVEVKELFKEWSVHCRYTVDPIIIENNTISQRKIEKFLNFAKLINETLIIHILPNLKKYA